MPPFPDIITSDDPRFDFSRMRVVALHAGPPRRIPVSPRTPPIRLYDAVPRGDGEVIDYRLRRSGRLECARRHVIASTQADSRVDAVGEFVEGDFHLELQGDGASFLVPFFDGIIQPQQQWKVVKQPQVITADVLMHQLKIGTASAPLERLDSLDMVGSFMEAEKAMIVAKFPWAPRAEEARGILCMLALSIPAARSGQIRWGELDAGGGDEVGRWHDEFCRDRPDLELHGHGWHPIWWIRRGRVVACRAMPWMAPFGDLAGNTHRLLDQD